MKNCPGEIFFIKYAYGELSNRKRENFEKHMETCASCRSEISSLDSIRCFVKISLPKKTPDLATISVINKISLKVVDEITLQLDKIHPIFKSWHFRTFWFGTGAFATAAAMLMVFLRLNSFAPADNISPAGDETNIAAISEKIEGLKSSIENNKYGGDVYETSMAEIKKKIESLSSEIGEDI